jgi:hypothetical protein
MISLGTTKDSPGLRRHILISDNTPRIEGESCESSRAGPFTGHEGNATIDSAFFSASRKTEKWEALWDVEIDYSVWSAVACTKTCYHVSGVAVVLK